MTAIWFIVAAMIGAALLALLWPLSRRRTPQAALSLGQGLSTETGFYQDQIAEIERDLARGLIAAPEAEAARAEAARRLLRASREGRTEESALGEPHLRQRRAASAFALSTIPLLALLVYGHFGSPTVPSQTEADRQAAKSTGQDVVKAIAKVEARLAASPDDARGWEVIAPVYMRIGRFTDAARAYREVLRLKGEDAERLASLGEALVAASEGGVTPEARAVFEQALGREPSAAKPQFYLARGDELAGDLPGATRRLEALVAQGPADAPWMKLVQSNLTRLKAAAPAAAAGPEQPRPAPQAGKDGKPAPGVDLQALPAEQRAAIRGMVEGLDKRLAASGGSLDEWVRLLRSYRALGDRAKALEVLERGRQAMADNAEARSRFDAEASELGIAPGDGRQGRSGAEQSIAESAANESSPSAAPAAGPDPSAAAVKTMAPADRDAAIRTLAHRLNQRLAHRGGHVEDWIRLVQAYSALGDLDHARSALERARMALAADPGAAARLDTLARSLGPGALAAKP